MPTDPGRSHRLQAPEQLTLQQTPLAQEPEEQLFAAAHASPSPNLGVHTPLLQNAVLTQLASEVQVVGHAPLVPLQTNGLHDGAPVLPTEKRVHVPTLPAALQRSHPPEHALEQHTPSEQAFERH